MRARNLFFLVFTSTVFANSIAEKLDESILQFYKNENRIVTYSIQFFEEPDDKYVTQVYIPETFYYGRNSLRLTEQKRGKRRMRRLYFFLTGKEWLPVANRLIQKDEVLKSVMITANWVEINKVNPAVIRREEDILGKKSRYIKRKGAVFYRNDIKDISVLNEGDNCSLHYYMNNVYIVLPAIALKKGSIGSKIRVKIQSTGKMIEGAVVINSKNVEVRGF